ncbi:NYN domain-containing protein [Ruegeria lacuscaerulensis]|uniref:NYN domain-containing protein n=1 Tax=Ruegeria lacuscaerulensis TaxID=55218 RepID=UPI00147BAEDC|nr:NYN domain-containing protein [Ruegeria lacuscaerulensis]
MTRCTAILVDGDNISSTYANEIYTAAQIFGRVDIARVYMNAQQNSPWHDASSFHLIHSGTGKNATDLLLAIEATELAFRQNIETMVIASSDGDFVHLHRLLREHGVVTVGMGEAKTPGNIRSSCSQFTELGSNLDRKQTNGASKLYSELDLKIRSVIAEGSTSGKGIRIADLNPSMRRKHGVKISSYPEKSWRKYLEARKGLYELEPKGPDAHVRFKPNGFMS